jgi:hypothetical protein
MAGRLGNQMFEIANVYAQSLRHNRSFRLTTKNETGDQTLYKNSIFRKLEFIPDAHVENMHFINGTYHYTEYKPHETLPTAFYGYYQSEKFFKDYSENIKWLYEPTEEFIKKAHENYPELKQDNTVAIHVRRGDFTIQTSTFPLVTKEFIEEALKHVTDKTYCFIISDDILWCKENIKGKNFIYTDYIDAAEALWFMSLCKNFIISNSTFSWWGAYLSKEKDKKVIHPSTWFGPGFAPVEKWNSKDVYCENWISIPTKYIDPGLIIPI